MLIQQDMSPDMGYINFLKIWCGWFPLLDTDCQSFFLFLDQTWWFYVLLLWRENRQRKCVSSNSLWSQTSTKKSSTREACKLNGSMQKHPLAHLFPFWRDVLAWSLSFISREGRLSLCSRIKINTLSSQTPLQCRHLCLYFWPLMWTQRYQTSQNLYHCDMDTCVMWTPVPLVPVWKRFHYTPIAIGESKSSVNHVMIVLLLE